METYVNYEYHKTKYSKWIYVLFYLPVYFYSNGIVPIC